MQDVHDSKGNNHPSDPEDEVERQLRAIGKWVANKFVEATLIDVVGIFTGIALVLIGTIAALIYEGQLQEMRHTNELTARALDDNGKTLQSTLSKMQGQTDATNNLYGEAQKQTHAYSSLANTSKDALVSVQRAFISATPGHSPNFQGGRISSVNFYVNWNNSGSTPARHFTSWINWEQKRLPDNFDYHDAPGDKQVGYIGPHGTTSSEVVVLTREQVRAIATGTEDLTLWGWARYQDVFKGTKEHITRFCYWVAVLDTGKGDEGLTVSERACPHNNCTDDDCVVQ